jgi:hypothetical protein
LAQAIKRVVPDQHFLLRKPVQRKTQALLRGKDLTNIRRVCQQGQGHCPRHCLGQSFVADNAQTDQCRRDRTAAMRLQSPGFDKVSLRNQTVCVKKVYNITVQKTKP